MLCGARAGARTRTRYSIEVVESFANLHPRWAALQTTRVLAEEQFMKRALIEKIQGGIPLADAGWVPPPGWH